MPEPAATSRQRGLQAEPLQAILILVLAVVAYWPTLHGQPLWDDRAEIFRNPQVLAPLGWLHAWAPAPGVAYRPLATTAEWALFRLGGGRVEMFHLASFALHLAGAWLFWRVLRRLGVGAAWFGALLFAVHPVAVESVAHMAQFDRTLALPLVLGSLLCFLGWEEGRGVRSYLAALGLFLASLLGHLAAMGFPILLALLLAFRRRPSRRRDRVASVPFLLLSLVIGGLALGLRQPLAAGLGAAPAPWLDRLALSGAAGACYLRELFCPAGLMAFYPLIPSAILWPLAVLFWGGMLGGIAWLLSRAGATARHAGLGLATILLSLAPILGILPLPFLRLAPYSDHLASFACLGMAALTAGGAGLLIARVSWPSFWTRVAVIAVIPATLSNHLARTYRDETTFWSNAVDQNPDSWFAQNELGALLSNGHHPAAALPHLTAANALHPGSASILVNLSEAQLLTGQVAAAVTSGQQAVRAAPASASTHSALAGALAAAGQLEAAIGEFQRVSELDPTSSESWYNLGVALGQAARLPSAEEALLRAERIEPGRTPIHLALGTLLAAKGELGRAEAEFREVLSRAPESVDALQSLGDVLAMQHRPDEAVPEYKAALALRPGDRELSAALAEALRAPR